MRDIVGYLNKYENSFSKSERSIAAYIQNNADDILKLSAMELAEKTGTSAASVVRFCRTIGYKGFLDFKSQMERDVLYVVENEQQIDENDNVSTIKNKIIQYYIDLFDEYRSAIDVNEIEKVSEAISRAKKVFFFAEGGSATMAECARISFLNAGIFCVVETDASKQIMAAEYMGEGDVAIGITHSGRISSTIDAISIAKKRGATTVAITGSHSSAICKVATHTIACDIQHQFDLSDFQGSRLEEFCVLSIIQIAVLMRCHEESTFIAQRVRNSIDEKRRV